MTFAIMFILGVAVLSIALRSFHSALLQKLGAIGILATSFLIGYLPTHRISLGVACVGSWFLLPWLEILTRIRRLRLPLEKNLRHRVAPSRETFPALEELSDELEDEGFEHVDDAGWDWEDYQQFFRLYYKKEDRFQAAICMIDQNDLSFYFLSVSSRTKDGTTYTTWNYPFSHSLKLMPQLKINRLRNDQTFFELCSSHGAFLKKNQVTTDQLAKLEPEEIQDQIQKDLRAQVLYNIAKGVLKRTDGGQIRYSWRGLFFIWVQCLRDLVRLS
jgi:hypothetical protein